MHIYVLSRLYKKDPTRWNKMITDIEEGREVMLSQYVPLRTAVISELHSPGSGEEVLRRGLAGRSHKPQERTVSERSIEGFKLFCDSIGPKIDSLSENYLDSSYRPGPVTFEGFRIDGRFHFSATVNGTVKYCHVHCSKWDNDEIDAYIELLTIVGETRHNCDRNDVWFLDLTKGHVATPKTTFKSRRNDLTRHMKLLNRIEVAFKDESS